VAALHGQTGIGRQKVTTGLKPKDLVGIPWRVAFALQADGWYLRSDIIWHKPDTMPESVTDRPTKAHEMVFLLTKSGRYFYNAAAIAEQISEARVSARITGRGQGKEASRQPAGRQPQRANSGGFPTTGVRNARTVWTIAKQRYSGAHFATMPEALAERCILAGSRPGNLVLDPFGGSGTTARAAVSLGRRAVVTEINTAYLALARERTMVTRGLPLEVSA
jgi:DNA modification methylase